MYTISRYTQAESITKSDSANIGRYQANGRLTDAIYVGGAGVVPVVFEDGAVVNFTAVAGEIIPVAAKRVNTTNCTATLMVALYFI